MAFSKLLIINVIAVSSVFASPLHVQKRVSSHIELKKRGLGSSGIASFYNGDGGLGACGTTLSGSYAALPKSVFDAHSPNGNTNANSLCGSTVTVVCQDADKCSIGSSVTVKVLDKCEDCDSLGRVIDISQSAFAMLGSNAINSGLVSVAYTSGDETGSTFPSKAASDNANGNDSKFDFCDNGNRGNGKCADSNLCCSQYGWCGSGTQYCGK